jgi:phosphoglycolate phosphatase-like HAD superfamily hydrolase
MIRCIILSFFVLASSASAQPLGSWNEGQAKETITDFVKAVTDRKSKDYVAPADRIAVFDNDGTLWSEQPMYFQFLFMIDRVKAAAPEHPEWKDKPVFKALMAHDRETLAKLGMKPILELLGAANSGMTVGEYDAMIRAWLAKECHPKFKLPYTDLVYKPMQELLDYLRGNGFRTFIVSGGSVEFMRPWAEQAYGILPEQVIGSQQEVKFETKNGKPVITRGPHFVFVDDGPGKPVGIYRGIGKRPIAAFGNSDGDLQMLQVTSAGSGRHLAVLVHHDDAAREFAYDRQSPIGRLDKAWNAARENNWAVVSMKSDWKTIFAFEESRSGKPASCASPHFPLRKDGASPKSPILTPDR